MDEERKFNRKKVWQRALNAALGFFSVGYSLGVFNSSQSCVSSILNWGEHSTLFIQIMSVLIPFGALIGGLAAGFMNKLKGKRFNIIITDIIMIIGSIIIYFPNTFSFGIGRLVCGISVGLYSALSSGYIAEFTPQEMSASMGSLSQLLMMSGIFISNCLCMALPAHSCGEDIKFFVFLIFTVPRFVALAQLLILLLRFKKESPYWLLKNKQYEIAFSSIESIYNTNYAEDQIGTLRNTESNEEQYHEPGYIELLCCAKGTTKAMRTGTLSHFFQQISGINGLLFYSTLLFQQLGQGIIFSRALTAIGSFVRALALMFLFPFINKISKKKLFVYGFLIMGSSLLIIGILSGKSEMVVFLIIIIYVFFVAFTISVGPITWIYSSMVMTDKGLATGVATNWTTANFVVFFFPVLIEKVGLNFTFFIFSGINILAVIYFCLDMVDITGKSKPELKEMLSKMA